eukprot:PhF_6_TR9476/c0_g1_i1/m.14792
MSVTVPIVGGLGNQMFLIACGLATAARNGVSLHVPRVPESDSCFEPRPVYWDTMFRNIPTVTSIVPEGEVLPELVNPKPLILADKSKHYVLRGFFQSHLYFQDMSSSILPALVPDDVHRKAIEEKQRLCSDFKKAVVGIHVRRGDYLKLTETFEVLSPQEYYIDALETLYGPLLFNRNISKGLHVIIFSEDKPFALVMKGMIQSKYGIQCVVSDIAEDYVEMVTMSKCDDLIIANSSFSWWGAYLQDSPSGRVVAPSKWFVGKPLS